MTSYFVSAELSSFLGVNLAESISRRDIEHKILTYAKDKNLVSQENPIVIHTDSTLETLMNGKKVFNGFSIIPYLKHHLVAFDDGDTISDISQSNQMESNFLDEEESNHEETSNEETSNEEETSNQEETSNEETPEEENQEQTIRRVVLRDPIGNEFTFEYSNQDNVRIQRSFVMSNEEFRELTNTLCQTPVTIDKEQPYENIVFLIIFTIAVLGLSLWLSIFNNGLEKMSP